VAMTLSGEIGFQENVVVSAAIFTGSLMSLASIDSVNSFGRNRADLAYCQSHLAVQFLIDQYVMEVLPELLIMARKTGSFWNGVHAALSLAPPELEGLYRKDISSRFQLAFVFADYYVFWVAIALLFLVAAGVAIVRKQKKLAQMAREEKFEDDEAEQAIETAEPPLIAPTVSVPPPNSPFDPGDEPDAQIDMGEEKFPEEDEEEDEEFDDEEDDDYILADGVELEDEEDEDDELEDEDEEKGLEGDEGEDKKS
jgi:hypothetical protein